jgi:hypothetical protein
MQPGIVGVRVTDDPGERGALGQIELGGRLGEVVSRRRLDAVRAVTEIGDVEVTLEDLVLAHRLFERHRVAQLADFSRRGHRERGLPFGLGVGHLQLHVLVVLLGDAGATLGDPPGVHVVDQRPDGAL